MNKENKPIQSPNLSGLKIRRLDKNEGVEFVRFYNSAGILNQTLEAFTWQYLAVPDEHLWIYVAEPSDQLMKKKYTFGAIYCVVPRRFLIDKQLVIGSLSLQTFTSEAYRKRGLFVHLAQTCYQQASIEGMVFVYGSPNDNSMPGFLKNLNWRSLSDPKVWACVRPIDYLRGKFGFRKRFISNGLKIKELHSPHVSLDHLWLKFSSLIRIGAVRDAAFWDWRYIQQPNSSDRVFITEDNEGNATACCALGVADKKEGKRGYILDFMVDPQNITSGKVLLDWCTSLLSMEGCRLVVTCVSDGNPYRNILRINKFWQVPKRFHPPGPRLAIAVMNTAFEHLIQRSHDWHVTYGDYDVF